mmetsp:Transcript_21845/g.64429  ORF Transcript_21845/g.64429 Transcript_21845/m.64429 type:complete len:427 (+) Transcript_21845:38-1318(+)
MLPTLAVCASFLPQLARPPAESRAAPQPRCSVALALTLGQQPRSAVELLQLAQQLLALEPTPLAVAQLTDAIDYPRPAAIDDAGGVMPRLADALKRQRRAWLLVALLREDRDKYVETVSFLKIPRDELPNRQGVPLRACDPDPRRRDSGSGEPLVEGLNAEGLVPDCALEDVPMGENPLEAVLLETTRNIYAGETGVSRNPERSIRGLIDEMRRFMLSAEGVAASSQQEVLVRTLRTLMTPVLPPFYRIFMGGLVPRHDPGDSRVGADPKWLADGVQWVRARLPFGRSYLEPGRQLGPWFYAPALTAVVAPYAFGFLVGPASLNRRADGEVGGLVVEKCKFLQESSCKGMCLNSCKLPAQQLFSELGLPLRVSPNFETQECQWSFGEAAPPPDEDPTWPKGCVVGCTSREAMRELSGGGPAVRACE